MAATEMDLEVEAVSRISRRKERRKRCTCLFRVFRQASRSGGGAFGADPVVELKEGDRIPPVQIWP